MTETNLSLLMRPMNSGWRQQLVIWMESVHALGAPGWIIFTGFYALGTLLFIPGSVLMFTAGAIYGFWGGLALALISNGLSSLLSLLVTRCLLRDWSKRYFARNPKMAALGIAAEKDGWKIVCLTHLSPIMPFSLINYAFGLTRISMFDFLVATELGTIPSTLIYVYLGSIFGHLAKRGIKIPEDHQLQWLLQGIGVIATIAATIYITRAASHALKKHLPARETPKP